MAAYRSLVAAGRGRMPGRFISWGFDALQPFERFFLKPLSVYNHLEDPRWLTRYHRLDDWYRAPKDLPGPLYLRAVRELFKENRLVQGRFTCLGERVRLSRVTCPLCLVAGARDHITPPPQLLGAQPCFGSKQVREVLTAGGHIGTFMGRRELRRHWPGIFAWLRGEELKDPPAGLRGDGLGLAQE
jgi:poly(3-hydroxyalkanoate) synthetase